METPQPRMVISSLWFQTAVLTFVIGFAVMGYLAVRIGTGHPPIPARVLAPDGRVLFTGDDIMAGQHIFQRYGLMQLGTLFGHGAYLGPDFTAQYLHRAAQTMIAFHQARGLSRPDALAQAQQELKANLYDPASETLRFTASQVKAFEDLGTFYRDFFGPQGRQQGPKRIHIADPQELRSLTAYFSWAAWVCTTQRPGRSYSYTNDWPAETLAGNSLTADAMVWSALSLIALLGGAGLVLYAVGRYDLLGWHRAYEESDQAIRFRPPEEVALSPAQRATSWYFLVVAGLFLLQGLLGGANAHYHVEPGGFYGFNISQWFPYNLTRTWHVQLALFFVSASFLAMGIFLAPMIAGREPKHQEKLTITLFGAVVVVVLGSLAGEYASIMGYMRPGGPWFWVGMQGWEYLDLGRLWQILLVAGMLIWVTILARGLYRRLSGEHRGNLPWLFLYSALSIPVFYAAGLVFWRNTNFTVVDFWRFWVVHLWVEDFLELFTTIMVACIFVLLGVVRQSTATRVVYLDIILYSIGGVIGTMHHLYFSGSPAMFMAFGAFFSAMEVIPLLLLTFEAWRFMTLGAARTGGSVVGAPLAVFPHKWAVMFLIAVGFWNFLGAGVFGFLINLPVVSYYQIGTSFTANHGHGAMMGVYGMLAMGFFMFVARYFIRPDRASETAMRISFWSLNIGLGLMIFANLAPLGILQLYDSVQNGYWHARDFAFFQQPVVRAFEWARLPGDTLFIVGGILPVVYLAIRMFAQRTRYRELPSGAGAEPFTRPQGPGGSAAGRA